MPDQRPTEFGKRRPVAPPPSTPPVKRSGHVALLLMGTLAVGGGAYALMPRGSCEPASPGMAAPTLPCTTRGSSGGGGSSRYGFFGDSSSRASSTSTSEQNSGGVTRGGFGSLARAFGFSGRG